jgi:hypothetical protein
MSYQIVVRHIMTELFHVNELIMAGDICSNKTALPRCVKLCAREAAELTKLGCSEVYLEPYQAAGGWVGLTFSFKPPGEPTVAGSQVPRRIPLT